MEPKFKIGQTVYFTGGTNKGIKGIITHYKNAFDYYSSKKLIGAKKIARFTNKKLKSSYICTIRFYEKCFINDIHGKIIEMSSCNVLEANLTDKPTMRGLYFID